MKIALLSDIHVEFHGDVPAISREADVAILAGDIDVLTHSIDAAEEIHTKYGIPVIVIAGNHEFYKADYDRMLKQLRTRAEDCAGVHFLERDALVIDGIRFLGCTLWSNFAINGMDNCFRHQSLAVQFIADFRLIRFRGRRLLPRDVTALYRDSYAWLEQELAQPFAGKTVVITHFAPHYASIHPDFLTHGIDDLTPYFTSDCSALMRKYPIAAWFYGHTHNSVDVIVDRGTRLVSNQRGYPNERYTYTRFDPHKLIVI